MYSIFLPELGVLEEKWFLVFLPQAARFIALGIKF